MIIFNVMLGKKLGGIEQSFLDYNKLLTDQGYQIINITSVKAQINSRLQRDVTCYNIRNYGKRDFVSGWKIKKLFNKYHPKIIFAHGNRAISLTKFFIPNNYIFGILHNLNINTIKSCQNVIVVSSYMKELLRQSKTIRKIYHVPNMIDMQNVKIAPRLKSDKQIITIGVLGRLSPEKDFRTFINALSLLKKDNIKFKALIAGDGPEKEDLIRLVEILQLQDNITFLGWVDDKSIFFNQIDIFCLTSIRESFGIVLLEAMAYKKPIISTETEGAKEILSDNVDSLIIPKCNPQALTESIKRLMNCGLLQEYLIKNGFMKVCDKYARTNVSRLLEIVIQTTIRES